MVQDSQGDSELVDAPSASADIDHQSSNNQKIEDYRQRYGLSIDPFGADPYFPFFTGGHRRELLDQIIHLCQFGYSTPIVLGERGVGKTRAALALYEAMGSDRACFVSALPTLSSTVLLSQVAQHFGVTKVEIDSSELREALQELSKSYGDDGLTLVVIDDAHDLDDQSLTAVLDLSEPVEQDGGSLRVVLFGDLSLIPRLKTLNRDVAVSDFYIERFTLIETVDYLNFRMEMADYLGPEMFNETRVEPWWRLAAGQLTPIHRAAREHLLETVLPPLSDRRRPFPVLHLVAIAVLGGAVLMTLLYRGENAAPDEEASVAQRVPINLQQPVRVAPGSANITNDVTNSSGTLSNTQESSLSSVTESESSFANSDLTVEQGPPVTERVLNTTTSQPHIAVEPPEAAPSRSADVPRPAPAASPAQNISKTNAPLSSDEEVLMSWNETDYTLQLLGVSTEKAARDFIANQLNQEDLLMFKSTRQGKDWFVVVAGRYPSAAAAKAAVSSLPREQAKVGPWARELRAIRKEIQLP